MITATGLTKRYGDTVAVDDLSFEVKPGIVTGFLGPNGAGKTTTMRLILGLDAATGGTVTVNGHAYRDTPAPMQEIGALIDPSAVHGERSAYHHLLWQAQAGGLPKRRVDDAPFAADASSTASPPPRPILWYLFPASRPPRKTVPWCLHADTARSLCSSQTNWESGGRLPRNRQEGAPQ